MKPTLLSLVLACSPAPPPAVVAPLEPWTFCGVRSLAACADRECEVRLVEIAAGSTIASCVLRSVP